MANEKEARSAIWRRPLEELIAKWRSEGHDASQYARELDAAPRRRPAALATDKALTIPATDDEREQVELAARLRHQTVEEYIIRAINAAMRKQGVDGMLFRGVRR